MDNKKILVTGGSGFLGSALVKTLVASGHSVRVLDDNSRGRRDRLSDLDIDFIEGDVCNPVAVKYAVSGVDEVWHLAAVNGTKNFYEKPERVLDVGVSGIVNLLHICRTEYVKDFFLVSSSEVYQTPPATPTPEVVPMSIPDPHNPRYSYAASKIISEMMVLHTSLFDRVVILRPHNIYGPDMGEGHVIPNLARRILSEEILEFQAAPPLVWSKTRPLWGGEETRAFCHITDCIDAFMIAREHGKHKEIYNVGTDEEVSIIDLAKRIALLAGRTIRVTGGKPSDGGTLIRCPDISKLKALGYTPKVSLDEGLPLTLNWYWEEPDATMPSLQTTN